MPTLTSCRRRVSLLFIVAVAACSDASAPHASPAHDPQAARTTPDPTVTATLPSDASRSTTLDVEVSGSGFDRGTKVEFRLDGVADARVHVNGTRYLKSTKVVATITIAADAPLERYDVAAVTGSGKVGIGTEMFEVTVQAEPLPGGTRALGVNADGEIVGSSTAPITCSSEVLPVWWSPDGTPTQLPLGSYCGGSAPSINASGTILAALYGGASGARGFWSKSPEGYTLQEVPAAPNGDRPIGDALNDVGEMAGWVQGTARMYWWSAATGWVLMQSPAAATRCHFVKGINDAGEIVAQCFVGGIGNGYYWRDHTAAPVQLPRPSAAGDVMPRDINDAGTIVGYLSGSRSRAIRWAPGASGHAVEYLPDAGYGSAAYGIGDDGTVAGAVKDKSLKERAASWAPSGDYRLLGSTSPAHASEAHHAAVTPRGLVIVGTEADRAMRWTVAP